MKGKKSLYLNELKFIDVENLDMLEKDDEL